MAGAILLSPRAWLNPGLYRRILSVYELCLDAVQTSITIEQGLDAPAVRACLNQMDLRLRSGGRGPKRQAAFDEENPPEFRAAIRERLGIAIQRQQFLADQGLLDAVLAAELEQELTVRTLTGRPRCTVVDYLAALTAFLLHDDLVRAAAELDISPEELRQRLVDMAAGPGYLRKRSQPRIQRRVQALQDYLELAVMIETAQTP